MSEEDPKSPMWSEWWLILAGFALALGMIGAGIMVFPSETWLLGLGGLIAVATFYLAVQEMVGALLDKVFGSGPAFLIIVILFFGFLLVWGYWTLNSL